MNYHVSRNGQIYGPYTLDDLRRYVSSGNVLPTDMVKSDEMPDWIPVAQLLGGPQDTPYSPYPATPTPAYPAAPMYGATAPYAAAAAGGVYPDPPNLHWGLVLLFSILTCGVFSMVWDLVQALWVKKVQPQSSVLIYYAFFAVLWLANLGGNVGRSALLVRGIMPGQRGVSGLITLAMLVMMIVYRFAMRTSIEQHYNGPEPVGLQLSGVMTFFFGGLYFQYHFTRINQIKTAMRYGAGLR